MPPLDVLYRAMDCRSALGWPRQSSQPRLGETKEREASDAKPPQPFRHGEPTRRQVRPPFVVYQVAGICLPAPHSEPSPTRGERWHGGCGSGSRPRATPVLRAEQERRAIGARRTWPDPSHGIRCSRTVATSVTAAPSPARRPRLPSVGGRGDITLETTRRPVDHESHEPVIPVPERDRCRDSQPTRPGLRSRSS